MCPRVQPLVQLVPPWTTAAARNDNAIVTVSGFCPGPQAASFQVLIDFTPTGAGSATVRFTVQNTSGVYAFQQPAIGNPILTGIWFNVPAGAIVSYTGARILAGAVVASNGSSVDGVPTAAGCTQLVSDVLETSWYTLVSGAAVGQYGLFTSGLGAAASRKAGLVDPGVFVACRPQGSVFGSIVIAGRVRFTLQLSNLPAWFRSFDLRWGGYYWRENIGSRSDKRVREKSPSQAAPDASIPILLLHAEDDFHVPYKQSKGMAYQLGLYDKDVKLVKLEDDGHDLDKIGSRIRVLIELESFLATHLH